VAPPQFQPALPGYHYEFPRDFFGHPEYQTEWWYYTGNLRSADGRKFGFELTFFRSGVSRDPASSGRWDLQDIYFAHFALSDLDGKHFFHTERSSRGGPGLAGADASLAKVWNGSWSVSWKDGSEILAALAEQNALRLTLRPRKPPVVHGMNGVSQKSAGAGRASHYFSETRLQVSGSIQSGGKDFEVSGQAWMDHEFFTEQLAPEQVGWDWLSLQLEDNTELMLFRIRRRDGSVDPFSSGTFVDAKGNVRHLNREEFVLQPSGETWRSPDSGASYPIHWQIRVPSLQIALDATTPLSSQELISNAGTSPSYWEGAIVLSGDQNSRPLHGLGYLEMTGYDRPVALQ
jgi:predicted secreted hydrolase